MKGTNKYFLSIPLFGSVVLDFQGFLGHDARSFLQLNLEEDSHVRGAFKAQGGPHEEGTCAQEVNRRSPLKTSKSSWLLRLCIVFQHQYIPTTTTTKKTFNKKLEPLECSSYLGGTFLFLSIVGIVLHVLKLIVDLTVDARVNTNAADLSKQISILGIASDHVGLSPFF